MGNTSVKAHKYHKHHDNHANHSHKNGSCTMKKNGPRRSFKSRFSKRRYRNKRKNNGGGLGSKLNPNYSKPSDSDVNRPKEATPKKSSLRNSLLIKEAYGKHPRGPTKTRKSPPIKRKSRFTVTESTISEEEE
jgi:hypothetical protein